MALSTSETDELNFPATVNRTFSLSSCDNTGVLAREKTASLTAAGSRGDGLDMVESLNISSASPLMTFGFWDFSSTILSSFSILDLVFPVLPEKTSITERQ